MVKKKDELPDWVLDDIKGARFAKPELLTRTGYILEVYMADKKIDAQIYEAVEDGRHIITLDLPKNVKPADCQTGAVYEFAINMLKAPLAKKTVEFLKNEKEIEMSAIYQFELQKLTLMDVASDNSESEE
ncbi:MAG: hypothetical protein FJ354_05150 [Thaumarchaeota archaeon]|nr:hypothetical protein [Nitrososphaerota archaeon]